MKKFDEINKENSTLNKAGQEEILFILRGRDVYAPKTVLQWITSNITNLDCSDEKLREAFKCALKMRKQGIKLPD